MSGMSGSSGSQISIAFSEQIRHLLLLGRRRDCTSRRRSCRTSSLFHFDRLTRWPPGTFTDDDWYSRSVSNGSLDAAAVAEDGPVEVALLEERSPMSGGWE